MKLEYTDNVTVAKRNIVKRTTDSKDAQSIKRFLTSGRKYMLLMCKDKRETNTITQRIRNCLKNHPDLDCISFKRGTSVYVARRSDVTVEETICSNGRKMERVVLK